MKSKIFWLAVLGFGILAGIISCVSSDTAGQNTPGMLAPILPDVNGGYDAYGNRTYSYNAHGHTGAETYGYELFCEYVYEYGCTCDDGYLHEAEDLGRLDVQSSKLFVAGRYAGFITWGYFYHSAVSYPVVFAESSVMDTQTGAVLALGDIIDIDMKEKVLNLLGEALLAYAPQAAPYLYLIDETWLEHIVLCDNGLIVLLPPDIASDNAIWEHGFISVEISYDDLDDAFMLGVELGLREPPRRPMVALTFDDGPTAYTNMILDMLEAVGGRATFCVLGNRVDNHPETLRRAIALGSEVIGHSWNHPAYTRLNANAIAEQITRTSAAIEAAIGQPPPPIHRAPYGLVNGRVVSVSGELGYSILHWSVDPQDWANRCADWIYDNLMGRVIDGAIVLLHDIHTTTMEAMERVIPRLIEEGFQLVTASEIIEYFYGELVPGETYEGLRLPWGAPNPYIDTPYRN